MSSSGISEQPQYQLDVPSLLRQQAARRQQERSKIHEVAATSVDPEISRGITGNNNNDEKENDGVPLATAAFKKPDNDNTNFSQDRTDRATNTFPTYQQQHQEERSEEVLISPARKVSSARCKSPTNDSVTTAQLKSRITQLEDETESLRSVVDLARKENAALRDLMLKMAKKTLGDEWRASLGIDMELGTALAGMGQPAAELTMGQRSRLIELLDGKNPSLLP